jgi:hypothetical protein
MLLFKSADLLFEILKSLEANDGWAGTRALFELTRTEHEDFP